MRLKTLIIIASALIYATACSAFTDGSFGEDTQLSFVENAGQVQDQNGNARKDIDFKLSAGARTNIFVGDGMLHWQFYKRTGGSDTRQLPHPAIPVMGIDEYRQSEGLLSIYRMEMTLVGANKNAEIIVSGRQRGYSTYYTTNTPPNGAVAYSYNKIVYKDIYPGIDWVLTTKNSSLKHEFIVHPGGNVADIRLKYSGAEELALNSDGSLTATTPYGAITEAAPVCYDEAGAVIDSKYVQEGDVLRYEVSDYEGTLTIDPELTWSTYFGGEIADDCRDIYIDDSDHNYLYVAGHTNSTSNIATTGAHQTVLNGSTFENDSDAFVAKFNTNGTRVWSTYLGGEATDQAYGVTTDSTGMVYICGVTESKTRVGTPGTYKDTLTESLPPLISRDAFVAKFTSSGALVWGTYIGGEGIENANSIATDTAGAVYVSGNTNSSTGMGTAGAHQPLKAGKTDAYVAKFSSSGQLQWSTYIGGERDENIYAVAADDFGGIYIGGYSVSDTGIATAGAYLTQVSTGNTTPGMLVKFNTAGKRLWGTYYGYNNTTNVSDIAPDKSGNIYIGGQTYSDTTIATAGAYRHKIKGSVDAYVAKLDSSGAQQWGTYYGGNDIEYLEGIALDRTGSKVFVCGRTESTSDISINSTIQTIHSGGRWDAYAAQFDTMGNIAWGTYYGGNAYDGAHNIAVDNGGSWYLAGSTLSATKLATSGAHQTQLPGNIAGYIARFCDSLTAITAQPTTQVVVAGDNATFSIQATGSYTFQWQMDNGTGFNDITNGGEFSGATTSSLTINPASLNQSGERYRCIVYQSSCREISADALLNVKPVGINEVDTGVIKVYPNPAEEVVTVSQNETIQCVEVLNMQGQLMSTKRFTSNKITVEIDVSQLPAGMYIIKVNNTNTTRVVKQ